MNHKVAFTKNELELKPVIDLRYEILRKPWNQPYDSARDALEETSHNAFISDGEKVVACGRLQDNGAGVGQVRYMAVAASEQGKGIGRDILSALEGKALELGLSKIELHARENAVKFYELQGYNMVGPSYVLWDIIPHFLMEKKL